MHCRCSAIIGYGAAFDRRKPNMDKVLRKLKKAMAARKRDYARRFNYMLSEKGSREYRERTNQ